jgi:hypothetical protein
MKWPSRLEKLLKKALSAERQAVAIYSAQVDLFRKWERSDLEIYEDILREEKSHQSEIEEALGGPAPSIFDAKSGYLFGLFLAVIPKRWNYRMHIWAEREAAMAYFIAWKQLKFLNPPEAMYRSLKRNLWKQTKQELSHRRRFQLALKKETL